MFSRAHLLEASIRQASLDERHVSLTSQHGCAELRPPLAALLLLEMVPASVAHHNLASASHLVTLGSGLPGFELTATTAISTENFQA